MNKEAWLDRWEIIGSFVQCKACLAKQHMSSGANPFQHVDGCTAITRFPERPWREYTSLLNKDVLGDRPNHPSAKP